MEMIAYYLIAINLVAFAAYVIDKHYAEIGTRRTSERTLLGLALIGGTPGAWAAMRLARHKTRKTSFRSAFRIVVGAQLLVLAIVATERGRAFVPALT